MPYCGERKFNHRKFGFYSLTNERHSENAHHIQYSCLYRVFFSFCGCVTRHTREWKNPQTASISSIPIRNCIITSHDMKVLEPVHIQLRFIQHVFNKWHFFSCAGSERIFVDGNKISFGTSKCYFSNDQNHRHQHHRRIRLVRESGSSHQNE